MDIFTRTSKDFNPGEKVMFLYETSKQGPNIGEVTSVNHTINKVDVVWPQGMKREDPLDLVKIKDVLGTHSVVAAVFDSMEKVVPYLAMMKQHKLSSVEMITKLANVFPEMSETFIKEAVEVAEDPDTEDKSAVAKEVEALKKIAIAFQKKFINFIKDNEEAINFSTQQVGTLRMILKKLIINLEKFKVG